MFIFRRLRSVLLPLLVLSFSEQTRGNVDPTNLIINSIPVKFDTLNEFIINEEKRLYDLKRSIRIFSTNLRNDSSSEYHGSLETKLFARNYVQHPINSYRLIKKLTRDWSSLKGTMSNTFIDRKMKEKPNKTEDNLGDLRTTLNRTVHAIGKIQKAFNLSAEDIAGETQGKLGFDYKLTLQECIKIGEQFYNDFDYVLASQWLEACVKKYETKNISLDGKTDFLTYALMKFEFLKGNINKSLKYLNVFPPVSQENTKLRDLADHIMELSKITPTTWNTRLSHDGLRCRKICKHLVDSKTNGNLKCRYNRKNSYFLRLAPLKEEIIHDEPLISIFRDVLSDNEIEIFKQLAIPRIRPATTGTDENSKQSYDFRVSETAFLSFNLHKAMARVLDRIEDMTKLNTLLAEQFQVAHYGTGGHYVPHTDYLHPGSKTVKQYGNRMATALFYMNEVKLGGGTAFNNLGIGVIPEKGSALVWRSVKEDGRVDIRVNHCGCPVLIGEKWIFTEWLREGGQNTDCAMN